MTRLKKLHNRASKLWKGVCYNRDGKRCMVGKYYPSLKIEHTNIFQVDHGITRSCKWTFYMPENGTVICSGCNMAKGFNNKSIGRAVDKIIIMREGQDKFDEMVSLDQCKKGFPHFNHVWWLEEQIRLLEDYEWNNSEIPL